MVKNKGNRIKEVRYVSETEEEIRKFVIIFVIVIISVVGIYFLSKYIVDKRDESSSNTSATVTGKVDYTAITVGTLLNRPYNEYYVMAYNSEDTDAVYYASIFSKYEQKENSNKIYFCDLNNSLNSSYVSENDKGNTKATSINDLSFGKITLLKIKNQKIVKYIENIDDIQKELK